MATNLEHLRSLGLKTILYAKSPDLFELVCREVLMLGLIGHLSHANMIPKERPS